MIPKFTLDTLDVPTDTLVVPFVVPSLPVLSQQSSDTLLQPFGKLDVGAGLPVVPCVVLNTIV